MNATMKCPRCGHDMVVDGHRKIDLFMCYECGYIEGRRLDGSIFNFKRVTNFEYLRGLNFNEMVAFLSQGLKVPEKQINDWLLELAADAAEA